MYGMKIKKMTHLKFKLKYFGLVLSVLLLTMATTSCTKKTEDAKAKAILIECVKTHGGAAYEDLNVNFDFRKYKISIKNQARAYTYSRTFTDSTGNVIQDILKDNIFERSQNQKPVRLSPKDHEKYKEAVNSVAYFALLPYKLLDPAVNATYIGQNTIEGQVYEKIKVSFDAEGGGKDHTDTFCYWINKETHSLDYLAYTNGGPRFRKAKNRTVFKSVTFQDYDNYEIGDKTIGPEKYDEIFKAGKAKLLSEIIQTNYK
jgi:hypothetical protein